jgi:hypothetical protein
MGDGGSDDAPLELGLLTRIDLPAAVPCASTSGPQPYYDITIPRYLENKTKQYTQLRQIIAFHYRRCSLTLDDGLY